MNMEQEEQDENWKNVYNNNIESSNCSKSGVQEEENDENEKMQNNINNLSGLLNNKENNQQLVNSKNVSPIKIQSKNITDNANKTNISNIILTQKVDSNEKTKIIKKKKYLKKEKYLMYVVQNYIVKYNFKKLIELTLQINYEDFDSKDKNEKFLSQGKTRP